MDKNIPTPAIARPSKIYPNFGFWFENTIYYVYHYEDYAAGESFKHLGACRWIESSRIWVKV
jgi:hypothetical protein